MRVLICGGRNLADKRLVMVTMEAAEALHGLATCVIEGGALGADRIGRAWARWKGLPVLTVDANWDFYKKRAGPVRNQWMLDFCSPELVVAFPTPESVGTYDMIRRAEEAGVTVIEAKAA